MANEQTSSTSVVEQAKEVGRQVIEKVKTPMLGDQRVVGKWFADKGNSSLFVLQGGGKGMEVLEVDGNEVTVEVDWWMKGDYLILTCHAADQDYEHWIAPGTYVLGGFQGESASGEKFRFYPLR